MIYKNVLVGSIWIFYKTIEECNNGLAKLKIVDIWILFFASFEAVYNFQDWKWDKETVGGKPSDK